MHQRIDEKFIKPFYENYWKNDNNTFPSFDTS
jgi:hypothetical protein